MFRIRIRAGFSPHFSVISGNGGGDPPLLFRLVIADHLDRCEVVVSFQSAFYHLRFWLFGDCNRPATDAL
jgi:hypothetical protein